MRKRISILFALLLVGSLLVGFSKGGEPAKATYLWQTELITTEKNEILSFLKENGVNMLYLRVDLGHDADFYKDFIREAGASGIEVHALGGHPLWGTKEHRNRIINVLHWVQTYNHTVAETERFRGIHLDIEPYTLPQWEHNRDSLLAEWMGNINEFTAEAEQIPDLEVGASLAVWLDRIPVPGQSDLSLSSWMLGKFDYITLLAYRDTIEGTNGIASLVEDELIEADRLDKKVIVAVNIKENAKNGHLSFRDKGRDFMNRQLGLLSERLSLYPSYAGNAIHDYVNWKESPTNSRDKERKATYVWHADTLISEVEDIIEFAKENDVNLLYTRLDLQRPYEDYQPFVRAATSAGIEVHALGGQPEWAFKENRYRIDKLVDYVKRYNMEAAVGERFMGIHVDIEPYVLSEWNWDQENLLRQWMSNISYFTNKTKENNDLETGIDLAFWLDHFPAPDQPGMSISKWMISQLDHVAVMAYRNFAEGPGGILDIITDELEYAAEFDKQILVCVEIKQNYEGDYVSFYEKGRIEMNRQLEQVSLSLKKHPSFNGVAVHAYQYWKGGND